MPIEAAGAVAWRNTHGRLEVVLVHRPSYDDWTIPKGKLLHGERWTDAAVRETAEETGVTGVLGSFIGAIRYNVVTDSQEQPKEVRFWLLEVKQETPVVAGEVDEVCWLTFQDAAKRVSHPVEREILEKAEALLAAVADVSPAPLRSGNHPG